jgi:hypothetical protein
MEDVGMFYGRLVYFTAMWYTYCVAIWYTFTVLVCCTKKNLATLLHMNTNTSSLAV